MRDPNSAVPVEATPQLWLRYDQWRADRLQRFNEKHAHQLLGWRNRRTFRRLVLTELAALTVGLASAVAAFFTPWFVVPYMLSIAVCATCQCLIRIVTGFVADAPVSALDEIQLAQRNSARSIGFIVMYSLMFIPYIILIVLSASRHQVSGSAVYGTAILLIMLLLTAGLLPTMLTTWWMSEPDPEDLPIPSGETSLR